MTARIYLTSVEGRSGKSSIALGVLDALLATAPRVGIFRPLIRSHVERDRVLDVMLAHAKSENSYADCVGVTYDEAHSDPAAALTKIVAKFKQLESRCDAVVIVGSDFTDVAAPTELGFNAEIAANLDAPVLLVLGGRSGRDSETLGQLKPRTPAELAVIAGVAKQQLTHSHARLLATVVNRADPDSLAEITAAVSAEFDDDTPVWTVPENPLLVAPQVSTVLQAIGGELVRGSSELLDREVLGLIVAGMNMEHVLARLTEGALLVIPADRAETVLAVTMAHEAPTFPTLSAIVLNGEFSFSAEVEKLLDGIDSKLPVIKVPTGTFDTAHAVTHARGVITPNSPRKLDSALANFRDSVDTDILLSRLEIDRGGSRTPTMFAYELFERAKAANAHIVLPEGDDDRILRAANTIISRQVAKLTILGDEAEVRKRAGELGLNLDEATVIDPATSPLRDEFAAEYARLRAHRGVTLDQAAETVTDVSYFGTMMVHLGYADGMVSGACHTTAHTIKPSFEVIKTKPGVGVVSSVFFMALADRVLVYGDCAVLPDPTAEQLADIAISSAETAGEFGVEPRIAMLSYSTGASGFGADVDKVRAATQLAQERRPDLLIEGPIQYDAASDPRVGKAKMPGSEVAGRATVFIFPDLNTGNNTYKAVQRSAGAVAVGPVLQGLNKPVNDLSRGATITDILNTVAITAVQAGMSGSGEDAKVSSGD